MVHPFISTQALRFGRLGGLTISVAAHTSLIALAVVSSGRALSSYGGDDSQHMRAERLVFIRPSQLVSKAAATAAKLAEKALARARAKAKESTLPDLSALHFAIEKSVEVNTKLPPTADLDFDAVASSGIDFGAVDSSELARGVLGKVSSPNAAGASYTEDVVERVVWPQRGNPKPYYPPSLINAGVEGSFVVKFVVDSTGRVDDKTISIPETAHRLFAAAVRDALRHSRYYPAELGGRVVRQMVVQRFVFQIRQ